MLLDQFIIKVLILVLFGLNTGYVILDEELNLALSFSVVMGLFYLFLGSSLLILIFYNYEYLFIKYNYQKQMDLFFKNNYLVINRLGFFNNGLFLYNNKFFIVMNVIYYIVSNINLKIVICSNLLNYSMSILYKLFDINNIKFGLNLTNLLYYSLLNILSKVLKYIKINNPIIILNNFFLIKLINIELLLIKNYNYWIKKVTKKVKNYFDVVSFFYGVFEQLKDNNNQINICYY